ncbi:MAG: thioredoxin family protein [Streptosporangiaceae bacterium]
MDLTVLTIPGCPNAAVFGERLAAALEGYPSAVVHCRQVADEQEAAETGMAGSPTLLINDTDPFATPGQAPALSCRLYRDEAGRVARTPSVEDLRRALEQARSMPAAAS